MVNTIKKSNKVITVTAVATVIALVYFFPVLIAVVNSFKTKGEILASAISFPRVPTVENYLAVIEATDFTKVFFNSCLVTGGSIVLNLLGNLFLYMKTCLLIIQKITLTQFIRAEEYCWIWRMLFIRRRILQYR